VNSAPAKFRKLKSGTAFKVSHRARKKLLRLKKQAFFELSKVVEVPFASLHNEIGNTANNIHGFHF